MDTTQNQYSSFKVTVECDKVGDMYEPHLWPDGVFVRQFYEAHKPRINVGPVNIEISRGAKGVCALEVHASAEMNV